MHVCTEKSLTLFNSSKQGNGGKNDFISVSSDSVNWLLFGNCIASVDHKANSLILKDCGWSTTTTAERLSAILNYYNVKTQEGESIYYGMGKGFYKMTQRPNKRDNSKMVWDYAVIDSSRIVVDSITGVLKM